MTDSTTKNELSVKLENFQSISKATLEFTQGINIIVGQSNSGKSAILRAIKGTVLNPNKSRKYIKNGTERFAVTLCYNNNTIEWSRDKKSPKYVINGEEYLKVGNSGLKDMLDNSGFSIDENNHLMNIESELELPFPFDKNSSELFKLFEKNLFCISDSTLIVKLIKADEEEVSKNKENSEYELERTKNKLKALEELEACVSLDKLINGRNRLAELLDNKGKLTLDIRRLSDIIGLGNVLSKTLLEVSIKNIMQDYITLLADIKKIYSIIKIGQILNIKPVNVTSKVFSVSDYTELQSSIVQLKRADKLISILRALEAPTIKVINEEYSLLREYLKTLSRLREQAQNLQKGLEDAKVKIQKLIESKNQFKMCPLCGGKLND